MKKILLCAATALACAACANKDGYTIEGRIEGLEGKVYLLDEEHNAIDSAVVKNGSFRFKGRTQEAAIRMLRDARGEGATFGALLILEPGRIVVADDPENPYRKLVSGTPSNDASAAYGAASSALVKEYRDPETDQERRAAIEEPYSALTRKSVEENRDNLFGALILAQELGYELSGQELLDEIAAFTPEMQRTTLLTQLREQAEARLRTEVGQPFIPFEAPDAAGREITLSSVVSANRYVLLDFWASWCGPCMGEVPHLKKAYDAFRKKGFEIYGVSLDKDRDKWLTAVEQNDMQWMQVCSLEAFDDPGARAYAVQAIPSNFLIAADGTIVAKNLRGEALYEKLAELLK